MDNASLQNHVKESFPKLITITKRITDGYTMNFYHWHPHYEITIVTSGIYTIINNSHIIKSCNPGIFIHCPYSIHNANAEPGRIYSRYIISFDKHVKDNFSDKLLDFSLLYNANLVCVYPNRVELNELIYMAEKLRGSTDYAINSLYIALILRSALMILESGRGEIIHSHISYIQDVLQYVTENLSEPQTVETLAARCGVGQSKFYSDFKANVGSTYKKYLTDLRQTRARELLTDGASIINASLECGYSSEAHFVKAFREYWGLTPGEYIRNNYKMIIL
jgi:AraC-like DNA-binding protein